MIKFFVPGIPIPKGSAKAFKHATTGNIVVMQTNREKQIPWASSIALFARQAGAKLCNPEDGVDLQITFYMPRLKSEISKKSGEVLPSAPKKHIKKPDLDKLLRCVKDALKGVAYLDDSQVDSVTIKKTYQDRHPENITGAQFRIKAC